MAFGPVGLRQQIIDEIDAAWIEQIEGQLRLVEFAGPGVGEDEVEAGGLIVAQPMGAVLTDKR